MKKLLPALFLLCSSLAFAQPQTPIAESDGGVFRVKKDSFAITKDNKFEVFWGLTVEFVPKGAKNATQHENHKMRYEFCSGAYPEMTLFKVNDYDTKVLSTHEVKEDDGTMESTMANLICDWGSQVEKDKSLHKDSIQSLTTYANFAKDPLWTADRPITDGGSEATIATLTESMKFEEGNVSIIGKIRYPAKTTEYIKFYIDKDHCKDGRGILEVKDLDATPRKEQSFDLKSPPMDLEGREFFKIAKDMCEYTMKNNKFRKVIRIEDYNKPVDTGPSVLEQMYGPNSKKK